MQPILDRTNPEAVIICASCGKPLWRFRVLGKMSHGAKEMSKDVPSMFSMNYKHLDHRMECPLCSGPIPHYSNKKWTLKLLDTHGNAFTID